MCLSVVPFLFFLESLRHAKDRLGGSINVLLLIRVLPCVSVADWILSASIGGSTTVSLGGSAVQLLSCFSFVSFVSFVVQDSCLLSVANGFLRYY